jgi:hypothetical protein
MALSDYSGQKLSTASPLVKRVLAATFPEYRGRKVKARLWTGPRRLENYWDGGTRSYYVAIRIEDGAVADFGTDNPFVRSTHDPVDLPAGVLLVEHSIFCGKDMGITIWARHDALGAGITPRLIGAGA